MTGADEQLEKLRKKLAGEDANTKTGESRAAARPEPARSRTDSRQRMASDVLIEELRRKLAANAESHEPTMSAANQLRALREKLSAAIESERPEPEKAKAFTKRIAWMLIYCSEESHAKRPLPGYLVGDIEKTDEIVWPATYQGTWVIDFLCRPVVVNANGVSGATYGLAWESMGGLGIHFLERRPRRNIQLQLDDDTATADHRFRGECPRCGLNLTRNITDLTIALDKFACAGVSAVSLRVLMATVGRSGEGAPQ